MSYNPNSVDCIEAQITADLKQALRSISPANGYTWTPGAVEEPRLTIQINDRYPFILLAKDIATSEMELADSTIETIKYHIVLIDVGNDDNEIADAELTYQHRNTKADLIRAIMSDHTRAGLAENTIIRSKEDGINSDDSGAYYYAHIEVDVQAMIDTVNPYNKG